MEKILTAMSGGVDSAVSCALLKQEGFSVGGAFMLLHDGGEKEAKDAAAAAAHLQVPFHIFEWKEQFRELVMAPFMHIYRQGNTPNPCILCNRSVKFGLFLEEGGQLGYDRIATGHYARIEYDRGSGRYLLKMAADTAKDQTYMLSVLTQQQLAHTRLPLGTLTKQQVREAAQELQLELAHKHDSQDICFIPDGDYMSFLRRQGLIPQPGRFIGTDGTDYGEHKGLEAYTLGQRRGLELSFGSRRYVVGKRGTDVLLGTSEELLCKVVEVGTMNWIPFDSLEEPLRAQAKLRYTTRTAPCTVTPTQDGCLLTFDEPQRAPTPGQTAVLYDGELVLGSGEIKAGKRVK